MLKIVTIVLVLVAAGSVSFGQSVTRKTSQDTSAKKRDAELGLGATLSLNAGEMLSGKLAIILGFDRFTLVAATVSGGEMSIFWPGAERSYASIGVGYSLPVGSSTIIPSVSYVTHARTTYETTSCQWWGFDCEYQRRTVSSSGSLFEVNMLIGLSKIFAIELTPYHLVTPSVTESGISFGLFIGLRP